MNRRVLRKKVIVSCRHTDLYYSRLRGYGGGLRSSERKLGQQLFYCLRFDLKRVFGLFLVYSCSISSRKLKNAVKSNFFLYLGVPGDQKEIGEEN